MTVERERVAPDLGSIVGEIRTQLRALPAESAAVTFQASTQLIEGLRTSASIRQFALTIDEPVELGGTDLGPNPVEVVLAALGTCQEIVYGVYAAAAGIRLERLAIDVEGDLDPRGFFGVAEVASGFSEVRFHVQIESPDSPERIAALIDEVNRHCPVLDILQRGLPVRGSVALNGQLLA
jgi:putative redox protein